MNASRINASKEMRAGLQGQGQNQADRVDLTSDEDTTQCQQPVRLVRGVMVGPGCRFIFRK